MWSTYVINVLSRQSLWLTWSCTLSTVWCCTLQRLNSSSPPCSRVSSTAWPPSVCPCSCHSPFYAHIWTLKVICLAGLCSHRVVYPLKSDFSPSLCWPIRLFRWCNLGIYTWGLYIYHSHLCKKVQEELGFSLQLFALWQKDSWYCFHMALFIRHVFFCWPF